MKKQDHKPGDVTVTITGSDFYVNVWQPIESATTLKLPRHVALRLCSEILIDLGCEVPKALFGAIVHAMRQEREQREAEGAS